MDIFANKNTLPEQARILFDAERFAELQSFKQGKKKSWTALGFTAGEAELIMSYPPEPKTPIIPRQIKTSDIQRAIRGTGKSENQNRILGNTVKQAIVDEVAEAPPKKIHPAITNLRLLNYTPREIHAIMGQTSHPMIAHMRSIHEQEKFRGDPRFPLYQAIERNKRYQAIFKGTPFKPIFTPG